MKRYLLLLSLSWLILISAQAQRYYTSHPRVKVERTQQESLPDKKQIQDKPGRMHPSQMEKISASNFTFEEINFPETMIPQMETEQETSIDEHTFNHKRSRGFIASFKLRLHQFKLHRSPKAVAKTNDVMSVLFWVFGVLFTSALGGFIANVIITGFSTITIIFLILSIVFLLAMVALIVISVVMT